MSPETPETRDHLLLAVPGRATIVNLWWFLPPAAWGVERGGETPGPRLHSSGGAWEGANSDSQDESAQVGV